MTRRSVVRGRSASRGCPVHVSVATRSAFDVHRRGGDMFESCVTGDGTTWAIVADVSSKRLLGVLHAEMVRHAFRESVSSGRRPAEIASALNRLRFDVPRGDLQVNFACAFICSLPANSDELLYASAGHGAAVVIDERSARELPPTGPILGVFDDASFSEGRTSFPARASLVVTTDGITEARRGREATDEFGTARIVESMFFGAQDAPTPAERLCRHVDAHCSGFYRDDATVAVFHRA